MGLQVAPSALSPVWPLCFLWLSPPPQLAICLHHGALLTCILTASQYPCVQVESSAGRWKPWFCECQRAPQPPNPHTSLAFCSALRYCLSLCLGNTSPGRNLWPLPLPLSSQPSAPSLLTDAENRIFDAVLDPHLSLLHSLSDANHQHLLVRVTQ